MSAAARYLRGQGLRVLTRGHRNRFGEIDLIAREGEILVFVEVEARRQGEPAEAVTPEKQRRLTLAATHFLRMHRMLEQRCRFDVVAIVWPDDRREPRSSTSATPSRRSAAGRCSGDPAVSSC